MKRSLPQPLLLCALAALAAGALVAVASHPYPGVTVDSAEYLAVARSLTEGHGLTMPYISYDEAFRVLRPGERVDMTQFPPLYPGVLALVQTLARTTFLDAVRVTGVVTFAGLVALVTTGVYSHARALLAPAAAAALLFAPDLVVLHAMAWSETLMLIATAATLHLAAIHFRTSSFGALVWAGTAGAVASMARFAGVAVLATVAVALLLGRDRTLASRLRRAGIFLTLTLLPTAAWFARNLFVAGYASEKSLGWHPPGLDHIAQAVQAVGAWFVPGKAIAAAVGAVAIVGGAGLLWRSRSALPPPTGLPGLWLIFATGYLLLMLATKTLLDQNISLDGRILAPLHVALIVVFCSAASRIGRERWLHVGIAVLLILTVGRGVHSALTFSSSGTASYTNERWRASETLAFAGALPRDTLIITNAPDPIWLWHEHNPQILPPVIDLYTGLPNEEHGAQVAELKRAAACRETFVLFFAQPTRKPPREIPGTMVDELDLRLERELQDGAVYVMDDLPPC